MLNTGHGYLRLPGWDMRYCVYVYSCFCGGDPKAEKPAQKDTQTDYATAVPGEWYDLKTGDRLTLNGDGSLAHVKNNMMAQPGSWKLAEDTVDVNAVYIDNDLKIQKIDGALSLTNEEYTFVQWQSLPLEKLSVGDKGQKENIAITLTGVTFTTELPGVLTDYLAPWTNAQEYALPAGMVYAKVSFDLENLSKQEINVPSIELKTDVVLDYNDGFRYATPAKERGS